MEPYPGSLVESGSTISVNLVDDNTDVSKLIMPDLKGKTLEEAMKILDSLNITYKANGSGVVDSQDVLAGKLIEKGTKVKLNLK